MYYEPYRSKHSPRQPRRRRKTLGAWLAALCLRLLALVILAAILFVGILYALPVSLFAVEPTDVDLSLTDGLPADRANVLLLGLDALHESQRRSDTVLVASIGYRELKLTSFLRDTLVNIPGHGVGKLNAAYARGGPELVMKTLNETFRLNLIHYVAVDYTALIAAVDALGGVDLPVTEAEAQAVNQLVDASRARLAALGYTAPPLAWGGDSTHLDGVQALSYARIRKLDSDFMRASRQRALLEAMLKKLRSSLWNPAVLLRLFKAVSASVDTSLSPVQLLSLGEKVLAAGSPQSKRFPVDGTYTDDGSSLRVDDLPANVEALHHFIYTQILY